jgi:hypothetical protein
MLACVGVRYGEDLLRYRRQAALQPMEKDLAMVTVSGTVGHVHHIPMVLTGWGVGVIALGRCSNIGPACIVAKTPPMMARSCAAEGVTAGV